LANVSRSYSKNNTGTVFLRHGDPTGCIKMTLINKQRKFVGYKSIYQRQSASLKEDFYYK